MAENPDLTINSVFFLTGIPGDRIEHPGILAHVQGRNP
jgi:hypothetical protein